MKMKPLNQSEYTMKIIKDLGMTTANENTTSTGRYAIFECTKCSKHFKARCGGSVAKAQTTCHECTLNPLETTKHPLYAIWNGIKQRCYSPKRKDYCKYGAKGVTMCDEWKNNPQSFIDWCIENGWNNSLVVDKDIKCRELNIYPAIYSPKTITFITTQENSEEANAKEVNQFNIDGNFIAKHISCVKAAASVGKTGKNAKSSIANCCRGVSKTAFGFKWEYVN